MKEQLTAAQKKNKKLKECDAHPLSPHPNHNINEPLPNLFIPPSFAVMFKVSHE